MCMHKYIVEEEREENQLILKLQNNKNQFKTILFLLLTLSQLHINDKSPALPWTRNKPQLEYTLCHPFIYPSITKALAHKLKIADLFCHSSNIQCLSKLQT